MRGTRSIVAAALAAVLAWNGPGEAKTVTVATPIFPSTVFSPYQGLSLPAIFPTYAVFDPLVVIDGNGRVRPWLAESWQSDDAQVWRVTLKDGIVFSNGRPLDADAVIASVAHMQTKTGRAETVGASLAQIDTIRAVSPRVVELRLKERDAMFPTRLALWKIPEPEGWARIDAGGGSEGARGTGPFTLERFEENRLLMRASPRARNKASIDQLTFVKLPDQVARFQAILASSADIAMELGIENRDVLEQAGGHLVARKTTQLRYVAFAAEHFKDKGGSPIQNPKVRQAMNYGVDKDAIIATILHGTVKPVSQLVFPGAPGYDAGLKPYPHDPARARALLTEAGYPNGIDIAIRLAPVGNDDTTLMQQVISDLKQVGVRVTVKPATQAQMTPLLFTAALEAELFLNFARGLDPLGDYRIRSCLGLTNGKPFFCDPEAMKSVDLARAAISIEQADLALRDVSRREHEDPPGIFLWESVKYDGFGRNLPVPDGYGGDYDFIAIDRLRPK